MPKLKFKDFMRNDESTPVQFPTSNMYEVKPKVGIVHGLEHLKDVFHSMEPEAESKPKRKYTKRKSMKQKANQNSHFNNVTAKAIAQAMHILRATKCAFKIVTVDGTVFAEGLTESINLSRRMNPNRPYGLIASHFKPIVKDMKVGDIAEVPWHPQIREDDLQSAMTAWMGSTWGKGSYATQKNDNKKVIEVLRYK